MMFEDVLEVLVPILGPPENLGPRNGREGPDGDHVFLARGAERRSSLT